jgi:DNA polymerase I-like protein with 3'-5' exonuclease and polymerase domains
MAGNLQMAMFAPKSEWIPPMELPDITTAKKIAIDVETRDPDIKTNGPGWATGNGEVVGYAVAVDGWSGYIPIRHLGGGNLDEKIVNKWLKKVFECPADKIMHNAQYDAGWIKRMGFDLKGRIIDTMLIASLLDENRYSYSLNALSYDLLGKTKSEKGLVEAARSFGVDPKAEMWKLPAMHVGAYGEADAELALELWNYFSIQLGKEDLWGIANLELELLPCLIEMTWRGVRVDQDRVEKTRNSLVKREREVMKEIKKIAGRDVEIWAAQSLVKAFDKVGLQYPKTEKGAPSFTKLFLQENPHPLAQLIVEARNLNKTTGTFLNTIMKHCHADGRIHSHINQIRSDDGGTVSGRLSMNSPNLQQIPARDPEIGPMIRSLFLPEEGEQWAAIDFSQQEPRILVHYAHVYGESRNLPLEGALDFVEAYNEDPNTDFHTMVAEMANIPRKQAKVVNLAMMYGMGVGKLSEQLDISMDDAKS